MSHSRAATLTRYTSGAVATLNTCWLQILGATCSRGPMVQQYGWANLSTQLCVLNMSSAKFVSKTRPQIPGPAGGTGRERDLYRCLHPGSHCCVRRPMPFSQYFQLCCRWAPLLPAQKKIVLAEGVTKKMYVNWGNVFHWSVLIYNFRVITLVSMRNKQLRCIKNN